MLIGLGFAMIAVFMYLILAKRLAPTLALVLVPLTFALVVTATGLGAPAEDGVVDSIMDSIKSFAPTAALLFFAIIYFGTMIDVGLFDPMIRFVLRAVRNDPVRLVVFTAVLAGVVSLDGDGSTTFIITVSALLPIYLKLGMSPVVLTVVANLANGVLNILPWGGPTIRAATVLEVSPSELFNPMVPGMVVGIATVVLLAWFLGRSERRRLLASGRTLERVAQSLQPESLRQGPGAGRRRRRVRRRRPGSVRTGTTGTTSRSTTPRTPTSSAASTRTARPCGPSSSGSTSGSPSPC